MVTHCTKAFLLHNCDWMNDCCSMEMLVGLLISIIPQLPLRVRASSNPSFLSGTKVRQRRGSCCHSEGSDRRSHWGQYTFPIVSVMCVLVYLEKQCFLLSSTTLLFKGRTCLFYSSSIRITSIRPSKTGLLFLKKEKQRSCEANWERARKEICREKHQKKSALLFKAALSGSKWRQNISHNTVQKS